jgi:hypothetical protein
MRPVLTKVIKSGGAYWLRVPAERIAEFPNKEPFSVKVYKHEAPYTTYVPTMQTEVKRFGKDQGLSVPGALVTAGILRHRQDVAIAIVTNTV